MLKKYNSGVRMMKIAVLSDIHGNHIALKRCMEELKKRDIKKIIFLGDYVGELAYPQKIMKMLREIALCSGVSFWGSACCCGISWFPQSARRKIKDEFR